MNDARRKEIDAMIALGVGEPWRAAAADLREALREAEASVADMCRGREHLTQQLGVLRTRAERAEAECANVFSREEACMRDLEAVGTALGWQAGEYTYPGLAAAVATLRARAERAEAGLRKINEIRNSIVGAQTVNFSEHIYPLVAVLNEAGVAGLPYPEARANVGTLIDRATSAEAQLAALHAAAAGAPHRRLADATPPPHQAALVEAWTRLDDALDDTAAAAEAYTRRVQAEAWREAESEVRAADDIGDGGGSISAALVQVADRLRARADEIERGPQEPESPVYDPGPCPLCVLGTPPRSSDALCFGHRESFRVFLAEKDR